MIKSLLVLVGLLSLAGCDGISPNNPYPENQATENIYYGSFDERPKYLDPARSYSSDESVFTGQIYEPPLQYQYEPNAYVLVPGTAQSMPKITYVDAAGKSVDGERSPEKVAETIYEIMIKPGIMYQPHPVFASGDISSEDIKRAQSIKDFKQSGTRELRAEDYVYEIKRLAWPRLNSPIYEMMSEHIVGLQSFHEDIIDKNISPEQLRELPLSGVEAIDDYTYRIRVKGIYRQFMYWLAMPFFAPVPWEADQFYENQTLIDKNIVLDWYPVGTGPYMMDENNPNRQIVLMKNPNFRETFYQGRQIPQIDKAIYTLEKESIPGWNKFLQGYYDASGVNSDNFSSAIQMHAGQSDVTQSMKDKGIALIKEVEVANYYWGFNMKDKHVGGYSEKQQKLRQAISIAIDVEEYIDIFMNGRGKPAQFILPPGLFGYEPTINPYVYDTVDGEPKRKSIAVAKQLLSEAGYPNGHDPKTGEPLIIHLDTVTFGGAQQNARDAWMRKQFKKLDIDLDIRATDYNRFREKLDNGNFEFFIFGWIGDYPDPENFLFLLYGPNGSGNKEGMNNTNYSNPEYDRLYQRMVLLPDSAERKVIIDEMKAIAQKDAPMAWGFNPESYVLKHEWLSQVITNSMVRNGLQYYQVDGKARAAKRNAWNKPELWPIAVCIVGIVFIILPVWIGYRRKIYHQQAKRFTK